MTPVVRPASESDFPAIVALDGLSFGMHYSDEDLAEIRSTIDLSRYLVAHPREAREVPAPIVGVTGSYALDVTVPGGERLAAPGVTWVSVLLPYRRRGVLRALMTEQHKAAAADGAAVSLLTASEGAIYGRFGYGVATRHRAVELTRHRSRLRADLPDPGQVRPLDADTARDILPGLYERWAAVTPGAVSRSPQRWASLFGDREVHRRGASGLFYWVHPDGYLTYRMADDTCRVVELRAVTDTAHVALWHLLLASDLVETIVAGSRPVEDPLPHMLTDPRQVRTTGISDGMWARVLDVERVLSSRTYARDVDVVIEVRDGLLDGVDTAGRYRLTGGPDGASCARTDRREPSVTLDVAALGSLVFGGERLTTLVRAGRASAERAAEAAVADVAFLADRSPQHGTEF